MWCVAVCDLETSRMRRPWPRVGLKRHRQKLPPIHEVTGTLSFKTLRQTDRDRQTHYKVKSIANCTIGNLERLATSL